MQKHTNILISPGERLPTQPTPTHTPAKFVTIRKAMKDVLPGAQDHDRNEAIWNSPGGLNPLSMDEVSNTVMTAGNSATVHHPTEGVYTIRELATLQTFPQDFEFCGNWEQKCEQIGNDVPVRFARKLFRHLKRQIRNFDNQELGIDAEPDSDDGKDDNDDSLGGPAASANTKADSDDEMTGVEPRTKSAPPKTCTPETNKRRRDSDDDMDDNGPARKLQHQHKQFEVSDSRPKLRPRPSRRH